MAECTSEERARALTDHSNFTCLSRGEATGLTVVVGAGLISLLAILFVFLIIAHRVRWRMQHLPTERLRIFHLPIDVLMASLLISDIVQAVGAVMSLKWVQSGKVEVGAFCFAQGMVKIFGATGVAFSTSVIAVYTFLGVWAMHGITSMAVALGILVACWVLVGILVGTALAQNRNQHFSFMGPVPYWCWVHNEVGIGWKATVEYIWLWLMLFLSLIYIPLYLWIRGNLIINERVWWRFSIKLSRDIDPEKRARRPMIMLAYPAVNFICVLPMSISRWSKLLQGEDSVSVPFTFFAVTLFALSGFFNAILLLKTRPSSGLFGQLMFRLPARPPSPREQLADVDKVDTGLGRLPPDLLVDKQKSVNHFT